MSIPVIKLEKVQDLLLDKPIDEGRGAFISAASGLSKIDQTYFIVSDDEMSLFSLNLGDKALKVYPLISKSLPVETSKRKKLKADFESIVQLDKKQWPPFGAMVAWPSGSTPVRTVAVVLPFKSRIEFDAPKEVNIMPLVLLLAKDATELNIEGVMIQETKVLLLQRGNSAESKNGFFELQLADFLSVLRTGRWKGEIAFNRINLGELNGVKLTLSDGVWTQRGLLVIAVAEETASTYSDGAVHGTVLLQFWENKFEIVGRFEPVLKLEGMIVDDETSKGITLMFVDDADDPTKASSLWKVFMSYDQMR